MARPTRRLGRRHRWAAQTREQLRSLRAQIAAAPASSTRDRKLRDLDTVLAQRS